MNVVVEGTPLCPAGHLPLKGGDRQLRYDRQFGNVGVWRKQKCQPISPLEGEMSGRTERGVHTHPFLATFFGFDALAFSAALDTFGFDALPSRAT